MKSLFISRVVIKNFRNFKNVDVCLGHKQIIIGENNVGKTNFLRALQLVLDPSFLMKTVCCRNQILMTLLKIQWRTKKKFLLKFI